MTAEGSLFLRYMQLIIACLLRTSERLGLVPYLLALVHSGGNI